MSSPHFIERGNNHLPRTTRACDACRLRKTRCHLTSSTDNLACTRCRRLQLQCTFNIVVEKRGPKRKHMHRNPLASNSADGGVVHVQPASDTVTGLMPLRKFPTDIICSRPLLRSIVDDYLEHIYPLVPVVHRPTFLVQLNEDYDIHNEDFFSFLVAICALTIGLLPSRFNVYCNFTSGSLCAHARVDVVERCREVLESVRGPNYFDKISFNKWAVSYLMIVAHFQVGKHNRARMFEVESLQLGRLLNLHLIEEYHGLDCIEVQLRKKGFWLLFYAYVHSEVQSLRKEKLAFLDHALMESLDLEALLPLDVEDEQISKHHVVPSQVEQPSLTTSFIVHSRIFWQALEDPDTRVGSQCKCCRSRLPAAQIAHLSGRLKQLRHALDDAPSPLQLHSSQRLSSPADPMLSSQFAAQRANIHVTHLWLQSLLLDQLSLLTSPEGLWSDREAICTQLLFVLHNTSNDAIEPNGTHLVYKVRDVAVGLLACPFDVSHPLAQRAQKFVREFTDIMARLDTSESVHTANIQTWIDAGRQIA